MAAPASRFVAVLLVCAFIIAPQLAAPAAAQAPPPEAAARAARVHEQARTFKSGQKIRVHLIEGGGVVRGRVIAATDTGLTLQTTPSDEPQLIGYDKIRAMSSGMQPWVKVAIGAGAVGALVLALQQ